MKSTLLSLGLFLNLGTYNCMTGLPEGMVGPTKADYIENFNPNHPGFNALEDECEEMIGAHDSL